MYPAQPTATRMAIADPFFPSVYFAKVPAEALSPMAHNSAQAMSHAEFRVFVALCRFRGASRVVNPTRETLQGMTGLTPNNISRATNGLQVKGWVAIRYAPGGKKRKVENYELLVPSLRQRGSAVDSPVHARSSCEAQKLDAAALGAEI